MTISSFELTSTPTAIFTSTGISVISTAYYCNTDQTSTHQFSVWLVQNGQLPSNVNLIYTNVAVTAGDTFVVDREKIVLDNGDSVYANCTANISATLSTFTQ
jgi:hypothetical protein